MHAMRIRRSLPLAALILTIFAAPSHLFATQYPANSGC